MSKYKARKIKIDGHVFDSIGEGRRYKVLRLLEKAGKIKNLVAHPKKFILEEKFKYTDPFTQREKTIQAIEYEPDFSYLEVVHGVLTHVIEDFKGVRTEAYRIKRKKFLKIYGQIYAFKETGFNDI